MMKRAIYAVMVLGFGGCASMELNEKQRLVYDRFEECRGASAANVQLDRVNADGSFRIIGPPGTPLESVKRCMSEKFGTRWLH